MTTVDNMTPRIQCGRTRPHHPHTYLQNPHPADGYGNGMMEGTTARCPGVGQPQPAPSPINDPDLELDDQLRETEQSAAETELARWWRSHAETEIDRTISKAVEYGATDLLDLGHDLARMAGRTVTDQQAVEIGIMMYMRGKLARIVAAITEGREPSVDSFFDLTVYAKMAIRNRETGGWPGTPHQTDQTEQGDR